jgi:hypothetical protein
MTILKPIQDTLLFSVVTLALLVGCDKKPEEKKGTDKAAEKGEKKTDDKKVDEAKPAEPEAPKGPVFTAQNIIGEAVSVPLKPFDLAALELPGLTIQAPETAKAEPNSPSGFKLLDTSVNFSISVREGTFNQDEAKKTFNIVDPEGKVADESDTHVIYERSGTGGFLFQAGVTVGDKQYTCGSVATGFAFTREVIDQSVAACKSITASSGAAPADGAAPTPEPAPAPQ